MALWATSDITTDKLATLHRQVVTKEAINIAYQINPLFHFATGRADMEDGNYDRGQLNPKVEITRHGNKFEATMRQDTGTDTAVVDGAGEYANFALSDVNTFGAAVGEVTHFPFQDNMRVSDWLKMGKMATDKQRISFMVQKEREFLEKRERTMATGMASTNDQAAGTIGGYPFAIRSTGSYLGIDRTDGANANMLPAAYNAAIGALPLATIRGARTAARVKGAKNLIWVAGAVCYDFIMGRIETAMGINATTVHDKGKGQYGFDMMQYGNNIFVLDPYCPAQVVAGLDMDTWGILYDFPDGGTTTDWTRHPIHKSVMFRTGDWMGAFFTVAVQRNVQYAGVTS